MWYDFGLNVIVVIYGKSCEKVFHFGVEAYILLL